MRVFRGLRPRRFSAGNAAVFAALLAALLLFANGPSLRAQDGDQPRPPDQSSKTLFLPSITGGAQPQAGDIIPNQFIVVLQEAAVQANAEAEAVTAARLSAAVNGEVLFVYDAALSGFAVRVPPDQAEVAATALAADPAVAYVEADRVALAIGTQTGATWGLDRIDQRDLPLNSSYTYANEGAGVQAYIIDTGMRASHSQFTGRVGAGYTAVNDGQGTNDCNGHGTHVSGTVGGTTYGVAKQVMLHPVRVLDCNGSGSNSGVIAGVNWVTANRQLPAVANMSLGGGVSTALDTAVRNSIAAGITYALAAGNENKNACNSSPARTAEALTVGATTSTDARASYSNYGACLDIFAPGSSITSAWNTNDSATSTISGTSMASPHVAGAAALYLAANPSASPAQVAQALTTNATQNKVSSAGTGSPNRLLFVGFLSGAPSPTATPTQPPPATATPVATQPAPTATPAPTANPTATPPPASCTNLLKNPGFESGRVEWTESSSNGYGLICTGTSCGAAVTSRTGSYAAWLAGANRESSQISQPVTLPAGQSSTLSFWQRISSTDVCGYDYGYVRVLSNGVTTTVKSYNLCSSNNTSGWVNTKIDLSTYAGKTVTIIFRATTDSSNISSFFIDDTQLVSGSACAAAAGTADVEAAAAESGEDIAPSTQPKPESAGAAAEIQR